VLAVGLKQVWTQTHRGADFGQRGEAGVTGDLEIAGKAIAVLLRSSWCETVL
jgi:hypothetical protein